MTDYIGKLGDAWPSLLSGLGITVSVTLLGCVLTLILSFILGFMAGAKNLAIRGIARVIIEFFRGTSLVVQLFLFVFVLPELTGMTFDSKFFIGAVALGLNYGAYGSEIVRGAINAVPPAQWEATVALNFSHWQKLRLVIVPQAWPEMLPPFSNLAIQLLKGSALVSLIYVADLTYQTEVLAAGGGGLMFTAGIVLVLYFLLSYAIAKSMRLLERRAKAGIGQAPPKAGTFVHAKPEALDQVGAV